MTPKLRHQNWKFSVCDECPFSKKSGMMFPPNRLDAVRDSILDSTDELYCHQTVAFTEDGEMDISAAQHCAGAVILRWKIGKPSHHMVLALEGNCLSFPITPQGAALNEDVFDTIADLLQYHSGNEGVCSAS